jgi:type II secretory pathway pseudopilin PulG
LVEVLVVIAMIGVLAAVTLPIARGMIARAEADSATVALTSALKVARNRAIAERREFEVHFEPPDNLRIARRPVPIGTPETISNTRLENGQTVMRFPGAVDTPDAFGGTGAVNFTGPLPVMFTSDGSLIDSNGDPVNGTIFLGVAGEPDSARAITIFGMTGLARSWKQAGAGWIE